MECSHKECRLFEHKVSASKVFVDLTTPGLIFVFASISFASNLLLSTYIAVVFFIMLSALLAILVDAYVTVKEDAQNTPLDTTLWQDIADIGARVWQRYVTHRKRKIKK